MAAISSGNAATVTLGSITAFSTITGNNAGTIIDQSAPSGITRSGLTISPPNLTTIFTPAASCTTEMHYISNSLYIAAALNGSCWPSTSRFATFSPGVCPDGYVPGIGYYNILPKMNETIVNCCPSSFQFSFSYSLIGQCQSAINQPSTSSGPIPHIIGGSATFSTSAVDHVSLTFINGTSTSVTAYTTGTTYIDNVATWLWAPSIQVRWRESDTAVVSLWSTVLAAYSNSSTSSSATIANTSSVPSASPTLVAKHHKISEGAIAGIVVGAVIALLLLGAAFLLFLKRKMKKTKETERTGTAGEKMNTWEKQELDGTAVGATELSDEKQINELYSISPPVEMPGHPIVQPDIVESSSVQVSGHSEVGDDRR